MSGSESEDMKKCVFILLLMILNNLGCRECADLVILNAKIWTVDRKNPLAEAVAVKGNRILDVGWIPDLKPYIDQYTEIIDARGRLLLPGFNDSHLHLLEGGHSLLDVNVTGITSLQEIQNIIAARVDELPQGSWITGRGWDHTLFNRGVWPDKSMLDVVAPEHPVLIRRIDGHVGWTNSLALKIAGIRDGTPDPEGGSIVRDPQTGQPTGILKESAVSLVSRLIPAKSEEQDLTALKKAIFEAKRFGITSVQDNSGGKVLKLYHRLYKSGDLTLRISEWLDFDLADDPIILRKTIDSYSRFCVKDFIELGQLKGFMDGTLGSRTALFFEPYDDDTTTSGLQQMSDEVMQRRISVADSMQLQVGLHCIGAKANYLALQGFANARNRIGDRDRRHRLEHAQVLRPADIPLLSENGVIASMQPTHCTSDKRWAEARIGSDRCKGAYAWKSIQKSGAKICFGTDWPVEPLDPMRGLFAAVTRRDIETGLPVNGWFSEQRLILADAIRFYTLDAAYAEFREDDKGSITQGKLADMILLSKDIFSISEDEILSARVVMTVFDGKVIYREKSEEPSP